MTKTRLRRLASALLLLQLSIFCTPLAQAEDSEEPLVEAEPSSEVQTLSGSSSSEESGSTMDTSLQRGLKLEDSFKEDSWTGAFVYTYPIQAPQGRNGMQPALSLEYSNQNTEQNQMLGYGWSLELPSIRHINKEGIENLYEENNFTSSLDGELVPLTLTDEFHGTYAPKIENGNFTTYEYHSDGEWTATSKNGTTYIFGAADGKQVNPDDATQVYEWSIEEERDTNGNTITYDYFSETGALYPEAIHYSGSGSDEGPFSIEFSYESRDDTLVQNYSGFEIQTSQRLSQIEVQIEGDWIRRYALNYTVGVDGTKSLLESITESARSAERIEETLPSTEFAYTGSEVGWSEDENYSLPVYIYDAGDEQYGRRFGDVNGDGLQDILTSYRYAIGFERETNEVQINLGNGEWYLDEEYQIPTNFVTTFGSGLQTDASFLGDANGDGYVDIISSKNGVDKVYLNNKDKSWSTYTDWDIPLNFADNSGTRSDVVLVDINNDGFVDILQSDLSLTWSAGVYLNKGDDTGWELSPTYHLPPVFFDHSLSSNTYPFTGYAIDDFNNDGLIDFLSSFYISPANGISIPCPWDAATFCEVSENDNSVYINQGDGTWVQDRTYVFPEYLFRNGDNGDHVGIKVLDLNGDSAPDVAHASYLSQYSSNPQTIYINQGDGTWAEDSDFELPFYLYYNGSESAYKGITFLDLNNDKSTDILNSSRRQTFSGDIVTSEYYLSNQETPPDLLSEVSLSAGGSIEVDYKTTANYTNDSGVANPELPINLETVSEIRVQDGLGTENTIDYEYEGGLFFVDESAPEDRRFAGFASITKTEAGRETKTYYLQESLATIGKSYKMEVYDDAGTLFARQVDNWDTSDLGSGRTFVYKTQSLAQNYDGTETHKDSASVFTYDAYGNLATLINYGEVSGSEDGSFTDVSTTNEKSITTYIYASGTNVHNKIAEETVADSAGTILRKTRYYYDDLAYGSVSLGNLTREAHWHDGSGTWYSAYNTYNSYGNVLTTKNFRGYTTTYSYDAYNLYPAVSTNPKGYTVSTEYDLASGQVTSQTNENGATSVFTYDGFGRPLTISVPSPSTGTLTLLSTATYDDESLPSSKSVSTTVSGITSESISYFDGLGRPVQSKNSAESDYNAIDTWYDELGNVIQQSLPYESSDNDFERDENQTAVLTSYDVLNRPLTVTQPTGTTTYTYSPWQTMTTDANGVNKTYLTGSAGQLLSVLEENEGDVYTTTYEYDPLGQLVLLTDAQGNERGFAYDSLGRKTRQEDLHTATETNFGVWTYTYDKNGNLLTQTDPKGQVITWAYDLLDRVSYEDWDASTTARNMSYAYDASTNGKMKLYQVNMSDYYVRYNSYDFLGNLSKETRYFTKPGQTAYYSYAFQTTYDALSRPTKLIYPASALTVNYSYNASGALERLTRGTTSQTDIVSNFDYNPLGQVTEAHYGNGTVTTNTYDSSQAYRLTNKVTTGSYMGTSGNVQDLSYTYDANGNILSIVDASITPTAKTTTYAYDSLNRLLDMEFLTGAIGAPGTIDIHEGYEYDALGNLRSKSDVGYLDYTGTGANGANPHAVTAVNSVPYTYDLNGNLVSDGTHTYAWDARNHLVSSGSKTFSYDATGSRYKIVDSVSGAYTYYLSPYEELRNGTATSAGTPTYYIFAGSQRVASLEVPVNANPNTTTLSYIHQDHLGGTSLVTDSAGAVKELYDYYPYGAELTSLQLGTSKLPHSFTDKELDEDLGLYYFEARWYNPTIGRFASGDPAQMALNGKMLANPQRLNFYSYSGNNPIKNVDPTGESWYNPFSWDWGNIGKTLLQTLDTVPITGDASDLYACVTGKTLFTQQELSEEELGITAIMGILPIATGGEVRAGTQIADSLESVNDVASKYNWGDATKLESHLNDHGADFGVTSIEDYAKAAQDFYTKSMDASSGYEKVVDQNGVIRIWDSENKAFGAYNADGSTRTYFKPSSSDYWQRHVSEWDGSNSN